MNSEDQQQRLQRRIAFNFYFSQITTIATLSVVIGVLLFLFLCLGFRF